ncbi:MAG: CoA-binding protein [Flavobacteriaceae bacterium]
MHNTNKSTLILGASTNIERYSNKAFYKLKAASHTVFALGSRAGVIGDSKIYTEHQSEWKNVDTVTLYLSPVRQETYYDYLLKLKPRRVVFNPGTENKKLESLLHEAGIETEQACTLVLLSTNQY